VYIITCPHCSKPVEVSLASPGAMACDACGYAGPMPADAAQHLRAASELVRGLDLRSRQLSAFQRRALSSSGCMVALLVVLVVVFLLPALGLAGVSIYMVLDDHWGPWGVALAVATGSSPLALLLLTMGPGLWLLRRSRRALREATAAMPPRQPGSPARCRLCAADLARSQEPVVRCGYCGSDNLIDWPAMRRIAGEQHHALEGQAREVARKAEAVKRGVRRTSLALALTIVGGPALAFVVFIAVIIATLFVELPPDMERWYVIVERSGRLCAAETHQNIHGEWVVRNLGSPIDGIRSQMPLSELGAYRRVRADWFLGRSGTGMDSEHRQVSGRVESLRTELTGANNGMIGGRAIYLEGFCADPEPEATPVPAR
jgi:hypothetical protein